MVTDKNLVLWESLYEKSFCSNLHLFIVMLFVGCSDDKSDSCLNGAYVCSDNQYGVCQNGEWIYIGCPFGCQDGKCAKDDYSKQDTDPKNECTEGLKKCDGAQLLECQKGRWSYLDTCGFACVDGACQDECQEGLKKCDGAQLLECQKGRWSYLDTCGFACVDGACQDECQNGDFKCDIEFPDSRLFCSNGEWTYYEPCDYGCNFENNQCYSFEDVKICEPGELKCVGNSLYHCYYGTEFHLERTCDICIGGQCVENDYDFDRVLACYWQTDQSYEECMTRDVDYCINDVVAYDECIIKMFQENCSSSDIESCMHERYEKAKCEVPYANLYICRNSDKLSHYAYQVCDYLNVLYPEVTSDCVDHYYDAVRYGFKCMDLRNAFEDCTIDFYYNGHVDIDVSTSKEWMNSNCWTKDLKAWNDCMDEYYPEPVAETKPKEEDNEEDAGAEPCIFGHHRCSTSGLPQICLNHKNYFLNGKYQYYDEPACSDDQQCVNGFCVSKGATGDDPETGNEHSLEDIITKYCEYLKNTSQKSESECRNMVDTQLSVVSESCQSAFIKTLECPGYMDISECQHGDSTNASCVIMKETKTCANVKTEYVKCVNGNK